MRADGFDDTLTTQQDLREVYRTPSELSLRKEVDHLDEHCRAFIAHSPFVVLSTADGDGRCDGSPKGGPAGFVAVLDEHQLAIPDLTGNNRLDSLSNLVENPFVALLFLVPGLDETLRVNGRAVVTTDEAVLERCRVHGRRSKSAIGVEVETAYIHCAKALKRGDVWLPEQWPDLTDLPAPSCMLSDHIGQPDLTPDVVEAALQDSYSTRLWS
jgi:PPOX class probable FMN-dependent enzyme